MSETTQVRLPDSGGGGPVGVVCALPGELGGLRELVISEETRQGMRLLRMATCGSELLAVVSGIGKVRAAQAATLLLEGGARGLLVVGTCGGLRGHLGPGTLVHCTRAVQTDLAVREGREVAPSPDWLAAWQDQVPGRAGWFAGDCVADMETAAIAAVAEAAGTPWAALRAVTDRANLAGAASFRRHYAEQAGRAADTIPGLISRLG
jgi:adenosylhomocysteine nucleosidase